MLIIFPHIYNIEEKSSIQNAAIELFKIFLPIENVQCVSVKMSAVRCFRP